jgi:hypothetical protein
MGTPTSWGARAVITATAVLVLAGCGGGSSTSSGRPAPSSSTPPPLSTSSGRASHGLVVLHCSDQPALRIVDPASGAVLASHVLPGGSAAGISGPSVRLCDAQPGGAADALSPDLQRVAATGPNLGDGSSHAGWVDVATGAFTDATATTIATGFSASHPTDSDPTFDPATGDLWFTRSTGGLGQPPSVLRCSTAPLHCTADTMHGTFGDLQVHHGTAIGRGGSDLAWLNPSGTAQVVSGDYLFGGGFNVAQPGATASVGGSKQAVTLPGARAVCTVAGWASDTSVLCADEASGEGHQLFLVSGATADSRSLTGVPLLPPTDMTVDQPAVDPGGTKLAFAATAGSQRSVYLTSLPAAGASPADPPAPRQVTTLGSGDRLVSWR